MEFLPNAAIERPADSGTTPAEPVRPYGSGTAGYAVAVMNLSIARIQEFLAGTTQST